MSKLNDEWYNAFESFDTEEDVIDFIFEKIDTRGFEDSYVDVGGFHEPNECFKFTVEEKIQLLYDFMIDLINSKIEILENMKYNYINKIKESNNQDKIEAYNDVIDYLNNKIQSFEE